MNDEWPEVLRRKVAGGVGLEHAGDSLVLAHIREGDGQRGRALGIGDVEMEVGQHAVADVAALGDDLALLDDIA